MDFPNYALASESPKGAIKKVKFLLHLHLRGVSTPIALQRRNYLHRAKLPNGRTFHRPERSLLGYTG